MGDAAVHAVRSVSADDVEKGAIRMPHIQRPAWKKVQSDDRVHRMLLDLIEGSKLPEKKKTKGDFTRVKRLHNLYRTGQLKVAPDGLVTVLHTDSAGNAYNAISVPASFFPGLVHALHIKLSHPSRAQMQRLVNRFFYCAGHSRIIEEIFASCTICAALKEIPKELFSQSTVQNSVFGANFSADVIKKDGQLIFLCREKLSQLTSTRFIPDETADSLRDSIVMTVLELMPDSGATVQVDCAPGLQTLAAESKLNGTVLKKLGIFVDLGRTLNKNKNPVAENAIKEFHKERLKLSPAGGRITEIERSIITKNINSRIRGRGLTSKEMAFNRDQNSNKVKLSDDDFLSQKQLNSRIEKHPHEETKSSTKVEVGDNVFIKFDKSKLRGREMYKITKLFKKNEEPWAIVQKCESKFMSKEYEVKLSEIFPILKSPYTNTDKGNLDHDDDGKVNIEDEMDEDKINEKDESITEDEKEVDIQEINKNKARPPKRKAALKSREHFKKIINCLHVKKTSKIQSTLPAPLHGWNYDDWLKNVEDSDDESPEVYADVDSSEDALSEISVSNPTTPFTELLNTLDNETPALNVARDNAQSSMGLLQMFPTHDEEELLWDHSTSPPEFAPHNLPNVEPASDLLDVALQPRMLFVANNDYNNDQESLTSEDSTDDVFADPSILEVSINGTIKFSRSCAFRRKPANQNTVETEHIIDVAGNLEHGYTAEVEEEPEENTDDVDDIEQGYTAEVEEEPVPTIDDQARPKRRQKKIDYATFHRLGKK